MEEEQTEPEVAEEEVVEVAVEVLEPELELQVESIRKERE